MSRAERDAAAGEEDRKRLNLDNDNDYLLHGGALLRVPGGRSKSAAALINSRRRQSSAGETSTLKRDAGKEQRPASAQEDACSIATTTSDVNSDDDAISIANRLSQIVVEQEGKMWDDDQHAAAQRRLSVQAPPGPTLANELRLAAGAARRLSLAKSPYSSRVEVPILTLLKDDDDGDDDQATNADTDTDSNDDNRRDETEFSSPEEQRKFSTATGFQPERGNLRALETSRQRQQLARGSNAELQVDAGSERGATGGRIRAESFSGPTMLNIRRSAWTLSEFDQTFNGSNTSLIASGAGDLSAAAAATNLPESHHLEHLAEPVTATAAQANKLLAMGAPLSLGDKLASSNNLVIMASKNALCQQMSNSMATANNNTNNGLVNFDAVGRRLSTASCASSQDSSFYGGFFGAQRSLGARNRRRRTRSGGGGGDSQQQQQPTGVGGGHQKGRPSMRLLSRYLPVLDWLPHYRYRQQLPGDLMAGLVVATLNISISLSAAVVAETDAGTAFRASIVSTLVYSILCSSRHTSFGSWSIMSQLMLVSVKRALGDELLLDRLNIGPSVSWSPDEYERWHLNIIVMYTFLIGLVQLLGGLLNLGNTLASFIPEALGSSMIAATAFTMAIGQLANMCGTTNKILWSIERNTTALWADLKNPPLDITDLFAGLFRWIKQIALLIKYHEQINLVCVTISIGSVILLSLNQCLVQRHLEAYFRRKIFVPVEVILVVAMIVISYSLGLRENYQVTTCGPIVINFDAPNLPNLKLIRELWFESLATALISYSMVYVMSKQYSNKLNYEVDYNQELVACGAGNLIGGLFDALPATASFSRTSAKVEAGGQTQMASLINCVVLLVLAHFLGQYVTELPVCVTSAALFYGFVRMMSSFTRVFDYWRVCKVDFAIWCFTFVAILTLDLVNGFVYGLIFSIFTMLYRAQSRRCYMLGSIGSSDVYVPLVKYPLAEEIDGIKIFQFCGPIHYVCADLFERLLRQKTRVNVKQVANYIAKQEQGCDGGGKFKFDPRDINLPTHIILDFSMISFVDTAGLHIIKKIIEDYGRVNITILIASLASHVAGMVKSEPSLWNAYKGRFYVTLADAVHCAIRDRRLRDVEQSVNTGEGITITVQ